MAHQAVGSVHDTLKTLQQSVQHSYVDPVEVPFISGFFASAHLRFFLALEFSSSNYCFHSNVYATN
jgi:hypothetical protein